MNKMELDAVYYLQVHNAGDFGGRLRNEFFVKLF